jgi:hypothetical protein
VCHQDGSSMIFNIHLMFPGFQLVVLYVGVVRAGGTHRFKLFFMVNQL